ncbi:MAG: CPBP family intramembrane metalloprotease [Clostridiales bacterium]|nr:CPBP family intramembrane metalloprotease [Clostridiales bacterium]
MRLFTYYILHTFINTVRKLFKTWVIAFILVCALGGGLIGYFVGSMASSDDPVTVEDAEEVPDEAVDAKDDAGADPDEASAPVEAKSGVDPKALVELAVGAIILVTLVIEVLGADKSGSKIFLPADVPVLFASPLRPQTVLLFRLVTKLGTAVLASIYILFEVPVLTSELGIPLGIVFLFLGVWVLTLVTTKLLQTFLYSYCTTHSRLKPYISRVTYGILLVLTVLYIVYQRRTGLAYIPAACGLFNARWTRFLPIWGWLKGIGCFAMEGSYWLALLCLCLSGGTIAALAVLIRRTKVDFYEEALSRTQETAERLQAMEDSQGSGLVLIKRKKDRSERLRRDGLTGHGAAMFFHRSLYNRFRFAHFGFFTKTSETYLAAGIGMALLCRYVFDQGSFSLVGLVISGLAFFRALGNPLSEDTNMPWFRLVPEASWKKLLYSLLGGTFNCLLDVLIGLIPAAIFLKADPASVLGWILFAISVDMYATTVGTFIDISIPFAAGKLLKQLVQIIFIYFGLIPDAAILFTYYQQGHFLTGAVVTVLVNLLLSSIFLALSSRYLEPADKVRLVPAELTSEEQKTVRRRFSRVGLSFAAIFMITFVLQIVCYSIVQITKPSWAGAEWVTWVMSFVPMYLVAVPIGLLLLRKVPAERPVETESWSFGRLAALFPICLFLMYCGSFFGIFINWLAQTLIPKAHTANPVADMIDQSNVLFWRVLIIVILAPLLEEFLFRRQIIDRIRVYGEKRAVFISAVMFGLFHGNFSQMFYAFLLGLVFGYVYLRTGKLRYSIILHMLINFMGSVLAPELLTSLDLEAATLPPYVLAYVILLAVLFYLGLMLFITRGNRTVFRQAPMELTRRKSFRLAWCSLGILLFIACCLFQVFFTLLA